MISRLAVPAARASFHAAGDLVDLGRDRLLLEPPIRARRTSRSARPVGGRTLLATTSHDETVRIWDPATGSELLRLVPGSPVVRIGVVPASDDTPTLLIIGGSEGRLAALAVRDVLAMGRSH